MESLDIDRPKDQVLVTGKMDVKDLAPYLKEKLKRSVEVVPPPKKDEGPGGDGNKDADPASVGGEKKNDKAKEAPAPAPAPAPTPEKKEGGDERKEEGGDVGKKEEVSKEVVVKGEEDGAPAPPKLEISKLEHRPLYFQQSSAYMHNPVQSYSSHSYALEPYNYHAGYVNAPPPGPGYPIPNYGYHPDPRLDAPQIFSDENPNACSVM